MQASWQRAVVRMGNERAVGLRGLLLFSLDRLLGAGGREWEFLLLGVGSISGGQCASEGSTAVGRCPGTTRRMPGGAAAATQGLAQESQREGGRSGCSEGQGSSSAGPGHLLWDSSLQAVLVLTCR